MNYIKIILRNLWRQKLYSMLNIAGLSIGLAVSLLMFSYVRNELKYDRHFPKIDRLYRIVQQNLKGNGPDDWANGAPLMAPEIVSFMPEIESVTRLRPVNDQVLTYHPDSLTQVTQRATGFFADSTFFDVFGTEIIQGQKLHPLAEPMTMVITESLAKKLFDEEEPLGKTIEIMGGSFIITAVMKDFPLQTHFIPEYLLDWGTFMLLMHVMNLEDLYNNRQWAGVYTYAVLKQNTSLKTVREKMKDFRAHFFEGEGSYEEINERGTFSFQPVRDIHLTSHMEEEIGPNGSILYVRIFGLAAILILIIACVNYINIATAGSFSRIKESGIRKVSGAMRSQLIRQFMGESLFTAVVAAFLSILVIDLLLPLYNSITDNNLTTYDLLDSINLMFLTAITFVLGLAAGSYPALFVSAFKPVEALREIRNPMSLTSRLRTALVVFQFMISVFMIFSATIIYRQMDYFIKKDMGFDKENILVLELNDQAFDNPMTIRDELSKLPFISNASLVSHLPGRRFSMEGFIPNGFTDKDDHPSIRFLRIDEAFIPMTGIEITEGRNVGNPPGGQSEYILNNMAVQALHLTNPIGTTGTSYFGQHGTIMGVCKDFHYASLHHLIEPLIMEVNNDPEFCNLWISYLLVKLHPGNLPATIEALKKKIEELAPGATLNYFFLNDDFNNNYKAELKLRNLFRAFAAFAIFISCLGLFGLSACSTAMRTKEIGIRKAMGASLWQIVIMLPRSYMLLILIALLLALPPGYFFMHWWLHNFAYHLDPGISEFIIASAIALLTGILSLSYTSLRAGSGNPVRALRYE